MNFSHRQDMNFGLDKTGEDSDAENIEGAEIMSEEEIRQRLGIILGEFSIGSTGSITYTKEELELSPVERAFIVAAEKRLRELYRQR